MPFRRRARVTIENIGEARFLLYYQINYVLTDVPAAAAYFHAQFRRTNPVPYKSDHTILDGVKGAGQYVGTYMARGANNAGWWGEGEIKFFIDGDADFPTICGTGTEDYFGGAYNFDVGLAESTVRDLMLHPPVFIDRNSASASIAGTSPIPSAFPATFA